MELHSGERGCTQTGGIGGKGWSASDAAGQWRICEQKRYSRVTSLCPDRAGTLRRRAAFQRGDTAVQRVASERGGTAEQWDCVQTGTERQGNGASERGWYSGQSGASEQRRHSGMSRCNRSGGVGWAVLRLSHRCIFPSTDGWRAA